MTVRCENCKREVPFPIPKSEGKWILFMPRGAEHESNRRFYVCPECMKADH